MKLLVTGAAGFIGSNFVHYWLEKHSGDKITVVDALTYAGNKENLSSVFRKIKFIEADINDRNKVSAALKGVDVVVNFAAETHVDRSIFDPSSYWHSNVHGVKVLLEESHKAKIARFHHISTDEVYGELPLDSDLRFTEATPYSPRPDNLYALSKAEADKVVLDFYKKTGMFITISNCSNNYGPYQFPEKFIPIIVTNLIDKIKVPLHGDGRNVRDWIHAKDHSSAIDTILDKGKKGETYLIGTSNDRSNGYIAEKVVELYGAFKNEILHVTDRHSNDRRYAIDPSKISKELNWQPEIKREQFDDALKETINWYKKNQDWWRPLLERKAVISDSSKVVWAFISLDRVSGKTRFELDKTKSKLGKVNNVYPTEKVKDEHFVEHNLIRHEIVMKNLENKKWFQNSSELIKVETKKLAVSPETFGYIEDLAGREDHLNGDEIVKLEKIEHAYPEFGVYGIASWFLVKNKNGVLRMEGYYSWGWGPKSGAKLLVLLKRNGTISHIATQREQKFATGGIEYALPGGFPKLNEGLLDFVVRSFEKDLKLDVKKGDINIEEIISLGRLNPDSGMTNNKPNLYAIIASLPDDLHKDVGKGDKLEENEGIVLWPIEKSTELINKCDDAYLISAIIRLQATGKIDKLV